MDRYIGKILNNRYELTDIIGMGGMAVVYKANDKLIDRVVAVKILKDEYMEDSGFKRRFFNESRAIAMLSHVNIVDVYDVCLNEDIQYIVMEYIDGITLKELINHEKKLSWKMAINLTCQILSALNHAHEKGIIHRDIKPHNIMLLEDGTIKVADFGIARVARFETQTMSDKTIGSVHYISPEQAKGGAIDAKSDIYSVGIMLYEMLTGKLPFMAENPVSVAIMQVQNKAVKPTEINREIPLGLEQITLKAMEKNPSRRYEKASQMLEDLKAVKRDPNYLIDYEEYFVDSEPTIIMDKVDETSENLGEDNIEEKDNKTMKKKKSKVPVISGILCAFLFVFSSLGVYAFISSRGNAPVGANMVNVPNLVGLSLDDATDNNIDIKIVKNKEEYSDKYEAGIIIEQDVAANTQVDKGATVNVTISLGKNTIKVPDVTNIAKEDAIEILQGKGLKIRETYMASDKIPAGYIIKTDPVAGKEVGAGETVTIYINNGEQKEETQKVSVPNLVGINEKDAIASLVNAGLKVGSISVEESQLPKGQVIKQSVAYGSKLDKGTAVNITVSSGPKVSVETVRVNIKVPLPVNSGNGDTTGGSTSDVITYSVKVYVNGNVKYETTAKSTEQYFTYKFNTDAKDIIKVTIDGETMLEDTAKNIG